MIEIKRYIADILHEIVQFLTNISHCRTIEVFL